MKQKEHRNFTLRGENGKIYFGWYIVALGFLLMEFGYACIVSVSGVFTLPVTKDLGIEIGDFVMWMTIHSLSMIVILFLVQNKINEKMIRPLMTIGCVLGAIGMIGFSRATELWHFYIFSILLGFCMSFVSTVPLTVLITNWFGPKVRGLALSIIFGGPSIGNMILIPVLNKIVISSGWRTGYFAIAMALLICIPLILIFVKWSPEKMGISRMGDLDEADTVIIKESEKAGIPFSIGIRKISTWLMFLSGALLVVASVNVLLHTQTFLVLNGYSATFGGNIVSIAMGALFVGSIVIGALCDKGKVQFAAILTAVLFAFSYIGHLLVPSIGIAAVAIIIIGYGFGCPAVNVVTPLLITHMFGEKDNGRYVSYANMFISLGGAFGASIIGIVLNATGTYTVPFIVCTAVLLVCALIRGIVTSKKFRFKSQNEK